ncbi:hypothetical protein [Streptomyces sp. NPDC050504]|uniref:hypothetical protein n=1 Tax=Streptomyces sp. NPDC050504 TaxID=3365618 RepID=UPI003799EA5F
MARKRGVLPSAGVAADLVGAEEAARILGYADASAFNNAVADEVLAEHKEPDRFEHRQGSGGRPLQRRRWLRTRVEALAARRSAHELPAGQRPH